MITSSSDSLVASVCSWGNMSADSGCPSASMAIDDPVKIWWPLPDSRRSPRIRVAASFSAQMFPDSSKSTIPSLSEATTASYRSSAARRPASAWRASVSSVHTTTQPEGWVSSSIRGSIETRTSTSEPSLRWWVRWPRSRTAALSVRLAVTTAPMDRPVTSSSLQP